jgi:hypothetical protein
MKIPDIASLIRATLAEAGFSGIRQIRDRIHRYAFHELGADRLVAENTRRSANDLTAQAPRSNRPAVIAVHVH